MAEIKEHVLGILASGGGTNYEAIQKAVNDGRLSHTRVGIVVTDNPQAGVLNLADKYGVPVFVASKMSDDSRNDAIVEVFDWAEVDLGIGAGFLKLVGGAVLDAYPDEMLNIHPAPLYDFGGPGMHGHYAHQAVLDAGVKWSGPTVHLMDREYDHGRILAHRQVPVLVDDTAESLAARILPVEHDLYWKVIKQQLERQTHAEAYLQ